MSLPNSGCDRVNQLARKCNVQADNPHERQRSNSEYVAQRLALVVTEPINLRMSATSKRTIHMNDKRRTVDM